MECFAAFLSHTDDQIGRVLAFLDETGDPDDTVVVLVSDNGASGEGGAHGSINDVRMMNMDVAGRKEMRAAHRRARRSHPAQQLPVGLDHGGQHAVPALEARGARGRDRRPVHRAVPGAARRRRVVRRRHPPPVRARHRRVPDPARADRRRRARPSSRGVAQRPIDGTSFAHLLPDGAHDAPDARHAVLRDARVPRHLPPGVEGGDVQAARPRRRRATRSTRRSTTTCGSCTTSRSTPPRRIDLAAEEPERLAALVDLWWDEARAFQVLPIDNRVLDTILDPRPRRIREHAQHVYHPLGAPVPESIAVNVRNRSHAITADVELAERRAGRRRAARVGMRARRVLVARERRAPALRAQPLRQGAHVIASDARRRARCAHGFGFRTRPDEEGGGAARAPARRRRGGPRRGPALHADELQRHRRRADLRVRARARGRRRLRGAVPLHGHVAPGDGGGRRRTPMSTPRARFDEIMAEQ